MAEINIDYLNTMAPVSGFNMGGNNETLWGQNKRATPEPICH